MGAPMWRFGLRHPFFSWGGEGVHLARRPIPRAGCLFLPLQLLIDIFPWKLPEVFRYDPDTRTLKVRDPESPRTAGLGSGEGGGHRSWARRARLRGPGTPGGTRRRTWPWPSAGLWHGISGTIRTCEVYLTRDADTLIPIWKRGEMATEWKGDHPGVFISIHANALPNSRATRGFETYLPLGGPDRA